VAAHRGDARGLGAGEPAADDDDRFGSSVGLYVCSHLSSLPITGLIEQVGAYGIRPRLRRLVDAARAADAAADLAEASLARLVGEVGSAMPARTMPTRSQ
jgi:hypothetical protein